MFSLFSPSTRPCSLALEQTRQHEGRLLWLFALFLLVCVIEVVHSSTPGPNHNQVASNMLRHPLITRRVFVLARSI